MKEFDEEFRQSAVKKILDGQSVASSARELGVGENSLHQWKRARLASVRYAERKIIELRKKLREVEMECDILNNLWLRRSQPSKELIWYQARRMQQMYPASVL